MWIVRVVIRFLVKSNPRVVVRFFVKSNPRVVVRFFGEVESQGLVAVSFSLNHFLLLIFTHIFSDLPFCMHFAQI